MDQNDQTNSPNNPQPQQGQQQQTSPQYPPPQYPYPAPYPQYLQPQPAKSVLTAVLLTILFGPLGMFYSTVGGAIVMLFVSVFFAVITLGASIWFTWLICIIWAASACSRHVVYTQNASPGYSFDLFLKECSTINVRKVAKALLVVLIGVFILGGIGGTIAYYSAKKDNEQRAAAELAQRKEVEERLTRLQHDFEVAAEKEKTLQDQLSNAKNEIERANIQEQLNQAKQDVNTKRNAIRGGP